MPHVSKAQQFRLGIFITVATTLMVVFLIMIAGNRLMEKRDIYYVNYLDVSVNGFIAFSSIPDCEEAS